MKEADKDKDVWSNMKGALENMRHIKIYKVALIGTVKSSVLSKLLEEYY